MDLSEIRGKYITKALELEDLEINPFNQFEHWFSQAQEAKLPEPNAMSLATVDENLQPSLRTVLLKAFDEKGFVFYTNYESKKAKQIDKNPKVALLFTWLELQRQIKIEGTVERISAKESLKYFLSRPKGSQLGAWVSNQSEIITSRTLLEQKFEEMKNKFKNKEIPLPSFWGGYRVIPTQIEFWQGADNRLHDRFKYTLKNEGHWQINRLAP